MEQRAIAAMKADQLIQSTYGNRKCSFSNIDEIGPIKLSSVKTVALF